MNFANGHVSTSDRSANSLPILPSEVGSLRSLREEGFLENGGFGAVLVKENSFGELVALKAPVSAIFGTREVSEQARRELVAEAEFHSSLKHPHIIEARGPFSDCCGVPYFEMAYVKYGSTLEDCMGLQREGSSMLLNTFSLDRGCRMFFRMLLQVLDAVDFLHQRTYVHADLAPHNILVASDQVQPVLNAYLADFGISRSFGSDAPLVPAGPIKGAPCYSAPELLGKRDGDGLIPYSPASDVYSLGVILFQFLAKRVPFPIPISSELPEEDYYSLVVSTENPFLSEFVKDVPDDLQYICAHAIAKQKSERFQTCTEMRRRLVEFFKDTEALNSVELAQYLRV